MNAHTSQMPKGAFSILKYVYHSEVEDGERVRRVLFVPVSREKL